MNFNTNTSDFTAVIKINTSISLPTEIYINEEYWYDSKFNINILDSNGKSIDNLSTKDTNMGIHTFLLTDSQYNNALVTIEVKLRDKHTALLTILLGLLFITLCIAAFYCYKYRNQLKAKTQVDARQVLIESHSDKNDSESHH